MITSNVNRVIYKGNGVATEFAYPFKIFDRTDIKVLLVDKDGARSILTSDYYVDMETMKVYYPGYAPGAEEPETDRPDILQEGETLVIYREVPITQMDLLPDNYPFNVIEKMDDKSCVIDQQLADKLTRAITMGEETALTFDGTMPPIQPGKTLRVKEDGSGWEFTEDPGAVYEKTVEEKEQAAAQARAAALSADSANRAAQKAYDDHKALIEKDVTDAQNAANEANTTLEETKVVVDGVVEKLDELRNDGIFEYDANVDLQPVETPIRNQYYEVDSEGNLKPIDMSTIIGNLIYETNNKQNKLIAGRNISIEGNVISARSDIEVDLEKYFTKTEADNRFFSKNGGALSGYIIRRSVDDNYIQICGGTTTANGANLILRGKDNGSGTAQGEFYLQCGNKSLNGRTNGDLKWAGVNISLDGHTHKYLPLSGGIESGEWTPKIMNYTDITVDIAKYYKFGAVVVCSASVHFNTVLTDNSQMYFNYTSLPFTPAATDGSCMIGSYRNRGNNTQGVLRPNMGVNNNMWFGNGVSPSFIGTNVFNFTIIYLTNE